MRKENTTADNTIKTEGSNAENAIEEQVMVEVAKTKPKRKASTKSVTKSEVADIAEVDDENVYDLANGNNADLDELTEDDAAFDGESSPAANADAGSFTASGPAVVNVFSRFEGTRAVVSPEQENIEKWRSVMTYARRHTLLRGEVVGIERSPSDKNDIRIISSCKGFNVVIPGQEFFSPEIWNANSDDPKKRINNLIRRAQNCVGAVVSFMITKALATKEDGKYHFIIKASRQQANQVVRNYYFFSGKCPESKRPIVGSATSATIIAVHARGLIVEAFGCESWLPVRNLTATEWIDNLTERRDYLPGIEIPVAITSLELDKQNKTVTATFSRAALQETSMRDNVRPSLVGGSYVGQIIKAGKNYYIAVLQTANVLAYIFADNVERHEALFEGDRIIANIYGISPRGDMVRARCRKIYREYL